MIERFSGSRFASKVGTFLTACRKPNRLASGSVPPEAAEVKILLQYLTNTGNKPVIVGATALLRHLEMTDQQVAKEFRPTTDIDIFIHGQVPSPPPGWSVDPEAIGVISWVSPSGGLVDLLQPEHEFPSGPFLPKAVDADPVSVESGFPVAALPDLVRMKLNSERPKDLTDLLTIAQQGTFPSKMEIGLLNSRQQENLSFVQQWLAAKRQTHS